jgi:Mn2+/Fe2+ NRAMP family transporter
MVVASNKKVMGTRTNGLVMNLLGWTTAALMSAAAVALVVTWGK